MVLRVKPWVGSLMACNAKRPHWWGGNCFVAYALVTFVRYRLNKAGIKMSFEAVREELSYLQASIVKDQKTGIKFALPSRITQKQRNIYNALGLKMLSGVRVLNT